MKTPFFLAILFLLPIHAICGPRELASAIHYTPPVNFYGGVEIHPRTDPGDDPFSLKSPEFLQFGSRTGGGAVFFQYGLIGAFIGRGKVIDFLPVTSSLMKQEIENRYKEQFPSATPASTDEIGSLNAVNLAAARPTGQPRFFRFCWIQIETNIAVEITAIASDAKTFQNITNSLQSITIDKEQFLKGLIPKEAEVITNHLEKIEVGHIEQNNDRLGVCVFYTKEKIYSFTVAHTFYHKNDLDESVASFERLRDFSYDPKALRIVLIDIAPDIPQTSLLVEAETNTEEIAQFRLGDLRDPRACFQNKICHLKPVQN